MKKKALMTDINGYNELSGEVFFHEDVTRLMLNAKSFRLTVYLLSKLSNKMLEPYVLTYKEAHKVLNGDKVYKRKFMKEFLKKYVQTVKHRQPLAEHRRDLLKSYNDYSDLELMTHYSTDESGEDIKLFKVSKLDDSTATVRFVISNEAIYLNNIVV